MREQLVTAIADMNEEGAMRLAHAMLDAGEDPQVILNAASEAMTIVGDRFEKKEYFRQARPDRGRRRHAGRGKAGELEGDV